MFEYVPIELNSFLYISGGLIVTLEYTFISIFLGLILGSFLAVFRVSHLKILSFSAQAYTSVFRGTPVLLQLSLIYFAMPAFTGYKIPIFLAGVIAFSLNSAAYVCEIIRAGIQSIDKGQYEAARAFGVSYPRMMIDIIFPQAIKNILPALVNEVINLLKETAIISVIGGADLMRRAQVVSAEEYSYFVPLLIAAFWYYITVVILSAFASKLERRLKAV